VAHASENARNAVLALSQPQDLHLSESSDTKTTNNLEKEEKCMPNKQPFAHRQDVFPLDLFLHN
jgi:hypothetical protein